MLTIGAFQWVQKNDRWRLDHLVTGMEILSQRTFGYGARLELVNQDGLMINVQHQCSILKCRTNGGEVINQVGIV